MTGFIKNTPKTKKHVETLKAKGYEVTETPEHFEIECEGFQTDPVDLQSNPNALVELVHAKRLLTYTTKVTCPDGKVRFSVPLCLYLGDASCLVAKQKLPQKKEAAQIAF